MIKLYLLIGVVAFLVFVPMSAPHAAAGPHHKHYQWQSWTLQGEYSHLKCPGQYHEWVDVDGKVFPLGCFGQDVKIQHTHHHRKDHRHTTT